MSLFALLIALALGYYHPLPATNPLRRQLLRYADWLGAHFNGGHPSHGFLAWGLGALAPALAVGLIGALLGWLGEVFAWVWGVAVLYVCLDFKAVAGHVAKLAAALRAGDLERAREILRICRGGSVDAFGAGDIAKAATEESLRAGYAGLLGVLFWFVILGPLGALLFRASRLMREHWHQHLAERGDFLAHVDQVLFVLDWLPARAAGFSFAIVGNFQGAVECWRAQAWQWLDRNEGVLLAAGAGALGVRLGGALPLSVGTLERPELGSGHEADADYLEGATALIWRTVLFWSLILVVMLLGGLTA